MRQAIIERVARMIYPMFYDELRIPDKKACHEDAENLLVEIGFFELLQAAEECFQRCDPTRGAWTQIGKCEKCGTNIPTISWKLCDSCARERLEAAITKAKGA
ncbi:MAG: hypothetical protein M0R80_13690 [Proteobacteria bacterium]|jgi:hypothetical protein|nr:hypothetical protein [Pseudomonadota bacterium]